MRREKKPVDRRSHQRVQTRSVCRCYDCARRDRKEFEKSHADLDPRMGAERGDRNRDVLGLASDYWRKRRLQKFLLDRIVEKYLKSRTSFL